MSSCVVQNLADREFGSPKITIEANRDYWFLNKPSATNTMLLARNSASSYIVSDESSKSPVLERTGPTT